MGTGVFTPRTVLGAVERTEGLIPGHDLPMEGCTVREDVVNHCMRHYEEPVVAHCRTCARPYCSRCLVYSFGPDKPPFCVGCALNASGVRNKNKPVVVTAYND